MYSQTYFSGGNAGFGYVDYDRDKQPMVGSFARYLDLIETVLPHRGLLLDVGAATGFFLNLARARGWDVRGIEPSDYAACIARGKGLNVQTGVLTGDEGCFHAVTALDVMEHMNDPRDFLSKARRVLHGGGVLAVNTPDSSSVTARLLGAHWHAILPPEHVQLFSRQSLSALLQQEGFEVLGVDWIGKQFTVQYILQTLSRWLRIRFLASLAQRSAGSRLGRIAVPLNLRDNMLVLARLK